MNECDPRVDNGVDNECNSRVIITLGPPADHQTLGLPAMGLLHIPPDITPCTISYSVSLFVYDKSSTTKLRIQ